MLVMPKSLISGLGVINKFNKGGKMNRLLKTLLITMTSVVGVVGVSAVVVNLPGNPLSISWKGNSLVGKDNSSITTSQQEDINKLLAENKELNVSLAEFKEKYNLDVGKLLEENNELNIGLEEFKEKYNVDIAKLMEENNELNMDLEEFEEMYNADVSELLEQNNKLNSDLNEFKEKYNIDIGKLIDENNELSNDLEEARQQNDKYISAMENYVIVDYCIDNNSNLVIQDKNSLIEYEEPIKDGFVFDGWSTVENSSENIVDINGYTLSSDTTLYAIFSEKIEIDYNDFVFDGNVLKSYTGSDNKVIVPTSYSILKDSSGNNVYETIDKTFNDFYELDDYMRQTANYPITVVDGSGTRHTIYEEMDLHYYLYDAPTPFSMTVQQAVYCEGDEFVITDIGERAFENSTITNVTLPSTIENIGVCAFAFARNLTDIVIPEGVVNMEDCVFAECTNLTNITLPSSLKRFGALMFDGCNNLDYTIYENCKYLGNSNNPYLVLAKANNTSISNPIIHDDTKHINSNAFAKCSNLTLVDLPSGIITLGQSAFFKCVNLEGVSMPSCLEVMYNGVFDDCTKLTCIIIPASVEYMIAPFKNCTGFSEIVFEDISCTWEVNDGTQLSVADARQNVVYLTDTYQYHHFIKNV